MSAFRQQDAALSAEAIAAVAAMANKLGPIDFQPAPKNQSPLNIAGVSVSVHLDALVHAATKKKQLIGGSLLRLTKADENETEASATKRQTIGGFAATLVYMHVAEHFANVDGREPSPAHCLSIDVQYATFTRRQRILRDASITSSPPVSSSPRCGNQLKRSAKEMNWKRINEVAEKIDLWTSLVGKAWATSSAAVFAVLTWKKGLRPGELPTLVWQSVEWGFGTVMLAGAALQFIGLIGDIREMLRRRSAD